MKSYPKIIDRIIEVIREHKTFCIVGHIRPDGDCIGSQLGLALALQNEGKKVVCWNEDSIPQKLKFLDPDGVFQKPKRGKKFDCVIATDCASFERLGKVGKCIGDRKIFINIDHHESNTRYADINWVSAREPSCGELIYPPAQSRALAGHQAHRRLAVHRRFHGHRLVSISHDAARHVSHRRGTRHARREPRENLRRSLSIVSRFARATAQTCLQQIPPRRTTTASRGFG